MWTEHTEHVMLPQTENLQQMEEHLKAEHHPELEAPEMSTEVPNPVRRDNKELQPHINSKDYLISAHFSEHDDRG